ncbi:MAG: hypothetical protein JWM69_837, partial [Candidatus Binatus sp.]|nr:hypothetical protein [Candidatus Binatus sp.]
MLSWLIAGKLDWAIYQAASRNIGMIDGRER